MTERMEVVATVVLALAAVATAWSGYQASRWNGEAQKASGHTNKLRIEAARAQGLAEAQKGADLATFTQWVDAYLLDRPEVANFYFKRFRKEFKPAVVAWIATRPLKNPKAPPSPFAMPQYRLAAESEAKRLDAEADVSSATKDRNIQRATDYVLGVVLFSVALFFRRDEHEVANRASPRCPACHRNRDLRWHRRLDRQLSDQLFGVVGVAASRLDQLTPRAKGHSRTLARRAPSRARSREDGAGSRRAMARYVRRRDCGFPLSEGAGTNVPDAVADSWLAPERTSTIEGHYKADSAA